jgi:hypothetical protein
MISRANKPIRIVCNLESGACNPYLIRKVLGLDNITVKTNSRLHAKTLIQKDRAIIGSANISANGLSFEDEETSGWLETGLLTTAPEVISDSNKWFHDLWQGSHSFSVEELDGYIEKWKSKRDFRTLEKTKLSIFDAALRNKDAFKDRKIYFAIYRDDSSSDEAVEAYEDAKLSSGSFGEQFDFYEDWSDLPCNSYLINIYVGPKYRVRIDGITKTHHKTLINEFVKEDGEKGEITLMYKEDNIQGHKLSNEDKVIIRGNIKGLFQCKQSLPDGGFLVPLSEGIDSLLAHI